MGMSPLEPLLPCAFLVASSLSKKEKESKRKKKGKEKREEVGRKDFKPYAKV
jgi:hypothetical protein